MAKDASFDIVSEVSPAEVANAVDQTEREIQTRFDFKGSQAEISLKDEEVVLVADDEYRLGAVVDIFQSKCVRRGVSLKALDYGKVEPAAKGTVRQVIRIIQGIDQEHAKTIVKLIKDSKLKVQAAVQGDQVRVSGKSRDDLQEVIQTLKNADLSVDLQFVNYR